MYTLPRIRRLSPAARSCLRSMTPASFARGEGRLITQQSTQELAHEVKEQGRTRLRAELTTTPR
jgi:hypothetical protein